MPDTPQFTPEQQAEIDKQIDQSLGHHIDPLGVMFRAVMTVLTARLGVDFAQQVREAIIAEANTLEASADPEDRLDAPLVRAVADRGLFRELGVI